MKKIYPNELSSLSIYEIGVFAKKHHLNSDEIESFIISILQKEYEYGSLWKSEFCEPIIEHIRQDGYDEGFIQGFRDNGKHSFSI
jgi:hypothetical protein